MSEETIPDPFSRAGPDEKDLISPQSLEEMVHHRDTRGPVCPCCSL